PSCVRTRIPSRTVTRQLCRLGSPSISIRHSKHTPIMQYGAPAAPLTGELRKRVTPLASSAAATLHCAGTWSGAPLNSMVTVGVPALPAGGAIRWNKRSVGMMERLVGIQEAVARKDVEARWLR